MLSNAGAILGGGDGEDIISIELYSDGNNTVFGGDDDDDDFIFIIGDGDNLIYGGGTGGTNCIHISGGGGNTVFNGGGDDDISVDDGSTGDNQLHGSAGNDYFELDVDDDDTSEARATLVLSDGSGADTVDGFRFDGGTLLDLSMLSDLGQADADTIISRLSQNGNDVILFITAGQIVTFEDMTVYNFQRADPDDWLIL